MNMREFADEIARLKPNEALATGSLRPNLPDRVKVVTKSKLNGADHPGIIARTQDYIGYRAGEPALDLIDFDTKGMPQTVVVRLEKLGGFWPALVSIIPELAHVARVERASTSAGLYNSRTGKKFASSGGRHVYLLIKDGADAERFLKTLHERCWLAGLGWMMVGTSGQLLERSIVDRVCGGPERLAFEGQAVLTPPLVQDKVARHPLAIEGEALDTVNVCRSLSIVDHAKLAELRDKEAARLAPEVAKTKKAFVNRQGEQLTARIGIPLPQAMRIIERKCCGILLPDVVLPFDDEELAGATVAHVLADPFRFEGATLADPLEGIDYGRGKAKIMLRADGSPWIHSFAHGRAVYELKFDYHAAEALLNRAAPADAPDLFVRCVLAGDLDDEEIERLKKRAGSVAGSGVKALDVKLRATRKARDHQRAQEQSNQRRAQRQDPRPQILAPPSDAPWLPQMAVLNEVLGKANEPEPPMRDIDDVVVQVRVRRTRVLHAFTALGANQEENEETRLSAPEQPLLTRLSETELAELIERYIDYVDDAGRSVHLGGGFVRHFLKRSDNALPLATSITTLPIVLGDGTLLAGRGLDRDRGIVFRIPAELLTILPKKEDCTPSAVAAAMQYLADEWLCDVATDYAGKCILIAAVLSIIERSLLPERPAFWVTAGRRGGGKTTTIIMLIVAATGIRPAAAAWSPNEEERRKSLLAYLLEALPALVWDNIPRGAQISCPHIEKSCTTALYSDRKLGVSEVIATAAATINFFTGNNVGPRGDLASRSLRARLEVDRPDPENRAFRHPDPIGWTEAHRGQILVALYTVLLGNPLFRSKRAALETRFKTWWGLIGQAVEFAAEQHKGHVDALVMEVHRTCTPTPVKFRDLFLVQEADDEDSADLADALSILAEEWPNGELFQAADVAKVINTTGDRATEEARERGAVLRSFLFPGVLENRAVTAKAVGKRLKRHVDELIPHGGKTLILKDVPDTHKKVLSFYVAARPSGA
jgi:hypothetical protein